MRITGFLVLCLTLTTPDATARPRLPKAVKTVGRTMAKPFKTRPVRAVGRVLKRVLTLDQAAVNQTKRACAGVRRAKARRFDNKVLQKKETAGEITIGRGARKKVAIDQGGLSALKMVSTSLLRSLREIPVTITDSTTGKRRSLNDGDVYHALALLKDTGTLGNRAIRLDKDNATLPEMLQSPEVAGAVLQKAKGDKKALLKRYRGAVSTLDSLSQAYALFTHWPGVRTDPRLERLTRKLNLPEGTVLVVAVSRRTPKEVLKATNRLTRQYFKGVTHLWLDPLLDGKPGAEQDLLRRLPDKRSRRLAQQIINFRDGGVVRVFAIHQGRRHPKVEKKVRDALGGMCRDVASRVLRTDYYARASEGTRDSFFRTVAIGAGLGFAMDGVAEATKNPSILKWKPTVLGGWDDAVGGGINAMEMLENGHKKGVLLDAGVATGVGLSTSIALGTSTKLIGGKSVANLMLDPNTPFMPRVLASGLYGVASSGATFTMSFLPARHYYKPILAMVKKGRIAAPTDSKGRPLTGRKLKRWAVKQSLSAHLSYSAQKGGLIGVGLSGVLTAGFGMIPGWGGPAAANILLGVGGAAETLTTGGYLYLRENIDRRAIRTAAQRELDQAGR